MTRNKAWWEGTASFIPFLPSSIASRVHELATRGMQAGKANQIVKWQLPRPGRIKIIVDAAVKQQEVAVAAVVRDKRGNVLELRTNIMEDWDPLSGWRLNSQQVSEVDVHCIRNKVMMAKESGC